MIFRDKGKDKKEILEELSKILEQDNTYESGKILGSMCTKPHEFSSFLGSKYPEKNLGDPGLFPGTASLESECIKMFGEMLGSSEVVGNITTGGTEANIVAMRVAKKITGIKHPVVIAPESAHASFHKAADFMGFELKLLKLNDDFKIDLGELERALDDNTMAVVGIAGTTALGLVDPIKEMGEIVKNFNSNILFHVDAAFGGFVLPFLREIKDDIPEFDFRVKHVDSITCDPHKMGMNLIPSGSFILRKERFKSDLGFNIPYLAGGAFKHFNIVGTRPGNVAIACWGLMQLLGRQGFKKIVKECWEKTVYFKKRVLELKNYNIGIACEPKINVIGIVSNGKMSIADIDKELRKKGWCLGLFENTTPPLIRAVIMPHLNYDSIDKFFEDLEEVLKENDALSQ
ncbi:MAG: tyrosine decarboxylase MfnA [Promethearchaeota archaeon]